MDNKTWKKMVAVLNFVLNNRHSSFYRDKYIAAKIAPQEIDNPQKFSRIPFLEKIELINKNDHFGRLFFDEKNVDIVSFTSGTTSPQPLITFRSLAKLVNPMSSGKIKTKYAKRILLLLKPNQIPLNYFLRKKEGWMVLAGDIYKPSEAATLATALDINAIQTTPSNLIYFSSFLKNIENTRKIELLYLTGEQISRQQYVLIQNLFPNSKIIMRYSTQEAGNIGYKCEQLINIENLNIYHERSDFIYCEIIKNNGSGGELVVTTLDIIPMPLIRYRTGDVVEFIDRQCKCGSKNRLFEIMGRILNDKIKLNGVEFRLDSFEAAMKNISSYIEDSFTAHFYQEVVNDKIAGKIVIDLTPKPNVKIDPAIHAVIEEILNRDIRVSSRLSFKDFIRQGLFCPIKANFVEPPKIIYKTQIAKKLVPHF